MTDPEGYVKLWRRLLKHPLWKSTNHNAKLLFIHILLTANWKTGQWLYENTLVDIGPGERIGSSTKIAAEIGLTRQEFRHAVATLQNLEILARNTNQLSLCHQDSVVSGKREKATRDATRDEGKRYTRLTLINWDRWQGSDGPDGKPQQPEIEPNSNQTATRPQPESNQTATTIKEGKNKTSAPDSKSESAAEWFTPPPKGTKPKAAKKVKVPVQLVPAETYDDWKTLLQLHPKRKFGADIARRIFIQRVTTKDQSAWLVSALRAEITSGEKYWGRFDAWIVDRLTAMQADLTPDQVSAPDDEDAEYEAQIERERQEDYARVAKARQE